MKEALRIFFLSLATIAGIVLAIAIIGVAGARVALPATTCNVSEQQLEKLKLEMRYDEVKAILGCDGVRQAYIDYGQMRVETLGWRGTAWPYGSFEGQFVNGVMHGTKKTWLNVALSANKA